MSTQSFTLNNIILIESNFRREWSINFERQDYINNTDIQVTHIRNIQDLSVTVDLTFKTGVENLTVVNASVKMTGIFTILENGDLSLDTFINVNAPAIIFPFIREHLASLSVKAGINPILLQPINFVNRTAEEKN